MTNVPSGYENQREVKIFLKYRHIRRRRRHFQPHGCGATDGVRYPDGANLLMSTLHAKSAHTQSRVFIKSIITQTAKAIIKRIPQITIGSHHFLRLSCFSFALINPLMTINAKPNINIISIPDIKTNCKRDYQIIVSSHS